MDNTQEFSNAIRAAYDAGLMSAEEGAKAAHEMRNQIMKLARQRNSQLGRAYSKSLKETGAALDDLANKYALRKFNKAFDELTQGEREQVFLEIMDAAGRPNPRVTKLARRLGKAGRVMWVFTAGVAFYNIYTAEDKARAATREAATLGGGFAGGAAGGAIAGIWAGPVGVAIGIAVGGMVGAIIADEAFLEIAGPEQELAKATLPKYTRMFSMNEEGLAKALYTDCGIAVPAPFRARILRYYADCAFKNGGMAYSLKTKRSVWSPSTSASSSTVNESRWVAMASMTTKITELALRHVAASLSP